MVCIAKTCRSYIMYVRKVIFLKQCPTCRSVVDDNDTCPICNTSLVYEPSAHTDNEKIVLNRYYGVYLLKTLWFSVISWAFCVIRVIGWHESLDTLCVPILVFSTLSPLLGLWQRKPPSTTFYTKDGYRFLMILGKYVSAITAVVIATIPLWV